MNANPNRGTCPNCGRKGAEYSACSQPSCRSKGYHCIAPAWLGDKNSATQEPLIGRAIDGHIVVRLLGTGGFGRVYLAIHQDSGLKAAIKMLDMQKIDPSRHEAAVASFTKETRTLASLTHPAIVRLYGSGVFDGQPYLLMEYLAGISRLDSEIRKRIAEKAWFSSQEVGTILSQVLFALEHAHSKSIIHRDLKPDNIIIQNVPGNPMLVRLFDFGLAKNLDMGERTQHVIGTPSYMAPEQIKGLTLGTYTDLYSVGIMALELVSGRKPFPQKGFEAIFAAKLDPAYNPLFVLEKLNPSKRAMDFFRSVLAINTASRPATAASFRQELEVILPELGPLAPEPDDSRRSTSETPVGESKEALARWLDREQKKLATRKDWED